jgi:hypothetical protein
MVFPWFSHSCPICLVYFPYFPMFFPVKPPFPRVFHVFQRSKRCTSPSFMTWIWAPLLSWSNQEHRQFYVNIIIGYIYISYYTYHVEHIHDYDWLMNCIDWLIDGWMDG